MDITGSRVRSVKQNSATAAAHLRPYSRIISIAGETMDDTPDATRRALKASFSHGEPFEVAFVLERGEHYVAHVARREQVGLLYDHPDILTKIKPRSAGAEAAILSDARPEWRRGIRVPSRVVRVNGVTVNPRTGEWLHIFRDTPRGQHVRMELELLTPIRRRKRKKRRKPQGGGKGPPPPRDSPGRRRKRTSRPDLNDL